MIEHSVQYAEGVDFDMTTNWKLKAEPEELTAIVLDPELMELWCSNVFLKANLIERGSPDGLGMKLRLHAKGWLPFSFHFLAEITELVRHKSMVITLTGDFEGVGLSRVETIGNGYCISELRWVVNVNQPHIRPLIRLLKPIGKLNHDWAVRRVCMQLQKEVDRRRAGSKHFQNAKATFPHNLAFFWRGWRRINLDQSEPGSKNER